MAEQHARRGPPPRHRRRRRGPDGDERRDRRGGARRQQRRRHRGDETRRGAERDGAGRHVERASGRACTREHQLGGLGHRVEQEAREHQAERRSRRPCRATPSSAASPSTRREHVPPRRTDAAEQSDLLPPRRHAGGDGARHDEDRGEQRQSRDARRAACGTSAGCARSARRAAPGGARSTPGGSTAATARLDPVDVDPGRERDVDLIDPALAAEHGLGAEHVHQQQVAAERAPDAARWQDAAHGEGLRMPTGVRSRSVGADVRVQRGARRRR